VRYGRQQSIRTTAVLAALALTLGSIATATRVAADQDGEAATDLGEPAIGPGQEELVAGMLGKGATLPGACELTDGHTEYSVVTATYVCGGLGVVVLELIHPRHAAPSTTQTEHFAIAVESGSPPESLTDAIAALIRARESDFEWTWNTADAPGNDTGSEEDDGTLPGTPG
jgi:hypothetical protein